MPALTEDYIENLKSLRKHYDKANLLLEKLRRAMVEENVTVLGLPKPIDKQHTLSVKWIEDNQHNLSPVYRVRCLATAIRSNNAKVDGCLKELELFVAEWRKLQAQRMLLNTHFGNIN